jgi:aspartyl-tRNA(Asn)/glutamyl-tRNA(Gln) amidotransferase subunit A
MTDPAFSSLTDLSGALRRGETTSVALTQLYLGRIGRFNKGLHAYIAVYAEPALRLAEAADRRRASGLPVHPLNGVPIALKDLCEIEGHVTTAGSAAWQTRTSTFTGAVAERLLAAGMVVLGKTHMVEFAFGGWGTNPVLGTPRNPWDVKTHHRVPGGSSSGSGVAVAAGLAPAAIGSDTGGSVRIPAVLNGITGLKTTYGLISLHGAVPLSTTLDSIGPMTRTAADAALLTAAMMGPDRNDPNTLAAPALDFGDLFGPPPDIRGMRIAVLPAKQFPLEPEADVVRAWSEAIATLRGLGAVVEERAVPFDFNEVMLRNGRLIAAEAWALHRAYIEDASLPIGQFVRARVLTGKAIAAADYIAAREDQRRMAKSYAEWMRGWDALLTPGSPIPALPLDQVDESTTPLAAFTRAGNYFGACGLSLPAGFTKDGLPVGVQLMGAPFHEPTVIRIGRAFQGATDWHKRHPDLSTLG